MSGSKERQTKTGYLFKKGRGIKLAIFKPWAYRWFSLDLETGILKYYEEIEGYVIFIMNMVMIVNIW